MSETVVPPSGYQPLFLATASCEIFNLKPGVDITAESPMKAILKTSLLADIDNRRAVSDFQPYKNIIAAYPKEELLIFLDAEWKYGQNFYLITTAEAAEAILNPPKSSEAKDDNKNGTATNSQQGARLPWVSLGSEKEVDAENVSESRAAIMMQVSKVKSELGKDTMWVDRDADDEELSEYRPPPETHISELQRLERNIGIQAIPVVAEKFVQAVPGYHINATTQYEPISFTEREKKECTEQDSFRDFLMRIYDRFEYALAENQIVDIFKDQYSDLADEELAFEENNRVTLQEYQSFTELKHSKNKSISWIEWHPIFKSIVAVSCSTKATFDEKIEMRLNIHAKRSLVIFWSFADPIHPQLFLDAPDDVQCFKFNPNNPDIIVGGCANGQLVIWDISEYQERLRNNNKLSESQGIKLKADEFFSTKSNETPFVRYVAVSSIEAGHRHIITDLHWIPVELEFNNQGVVQENTDKNKINIVASSIDGHISFWELKKTRGWDAYDLQWKPFMKPQTMSADGTHDYSCTKINLRCISNRTDSQADLGAEKTVLSTKFFGGCDDGDIIYADWFSEKTDEKGVKIESIFHGHMGAVTDIERSPFFPDVIMTTGGWSFHILKEGLSTGSLLSFEHYPNGVTAGKWSSSRPGVFYIGRSDGSLEIWDLLDKSNAPTAIQSISAYPISFLSILPGKSKTRRQMMAVGDDNGTLYIMEIPKSLSKPLKNERSILTSFFDREVKRTNFTVQQNKQPGHVRIKKDGTTAQSLLVTEQKVGAKKESSLEGIESDNLEKQFSSLEKSLVI